MTGLSGVKKRNRITVQGVHYGRYAGKTVQIVVKSTRLRLYPASYVNFARVGSRNKSGSMKSYFQSWLNRISDNYVMSTKQNIIQQYLKSMIVITIMAILTNCNGGNNPGNNENVTQQVIPLMNDQIQSDRGTIVAPATGLPEDNFYPLADSTAYFQTREAMSIESHQAGPTLAPGDSSITLGAEPPTKADSSENNDPQSATNQRPVSKLFCLGGAILLIIPTLTLGYRSFKNRQARKI